MVDLSKENVKSEEMEAEVGGKVAETSNTVESQKQNLRLRLLLLFYDDRKIDKKIADDKSEDVEDGFSCVAQNGAVLAKTSSYRIFGGDLRTELEVKMNEIIPIKERLSGNKEKDKKFLKQYQKVIINKIVSYYCKLEYNEIYVDFLIPKDNDSGIVESIYELFLLDKEFIDCIKGLINLKKSSISILYPEVDKECSSDNLPNAMDAKIAALMSHYVYFYLDWLEYVHVHVAALNLWDNDLEKYKSYKVGKKTELTEKERVESIIKEFNNLLGPSFGRQILRAGAGKVKARVVGRLKEIAKIVNYGIKRMGSKDYSQFEKDITDKINSYMERNADDELLKQYIQSAKTESSANNSTEDPTILQLLKRVLGDSYKEIYSDDYQKFLYCELKGKLDDFIKPRLIINLLEDFNNNKGNEYDINNIQDNINKLCKAYNKDTKSRVCDIIEAIGKKKEKEKPNRDDIDSLVNELKNEYDNIIFVKARLGFINFLHEVAATSVYVDILLECKRDGRPIGFYDLYRKFDYWNHIGDQELEKEAKKWYVSHPYFVFKNDYHRIYSDKDREINVEIPDDENVPSKKIIKIIPRKSQRVFIYKNKYIKNCNKWIPTGDYLIYNTVLTHGMDQASGYGGLLFTKVEFGTKEENGEIKNILTPLKFAYCTKGTDVNSLNDWLFVDVLQGLSGFSLQHVHNVKNAITINEKVKELSKKNGHNKEIPLLFCGHSLGGGLASAGAIASKERHAITFNAAGLNFLGVLATRTLGGFNYSFNVPKMVHPIRIDGEAIDVIMNVARVLTGGLNERAYGNPELILKLKNTDKYDTSESGSKHGINNFLYKPLMNALEIVEEGTIKVPYKAIFGQDKEPLDTSIATLGQDADSIAFDTYRVQRKVERGNYIIEFYNIDFSPRFVSVYKYNIQEQINLIKKTSAEILASLKNSILWESPN